MKSAEKLALDPFVEPLSVGIWACRKARLRGGDHMLVTGAGPVGMLTMKVAFALGVAEVRAGAWLSC